VLERVGLEVLERQRLVRDHVVGELDHLDVEAALGADLLHDVHDLGMGTGGHADADGFGLGRGREQGCSRKGCQKAH